MNLPGSEGGTNWKWRYGAKALTDELAQELRALTRRAEAMSAGGGSRTPTPEGRRF